MTPYTQFSKHKAEEFLRTVRLLPEDFLHLYSKLVAYLDKHYPIIRKATVKLSNSIKV